MVMVAVTWIVPSLVFFITIFGWQYFVGYRSVGVGKCYVQYMEEALFNCILQVSYNQPGGRSALLLLCARYPAAPKTRVSSPTLEFTLPCIFTFFDALLLLIYSLAIFVAYTLSFLTLYNFYYNCEPPKNVRAP